MTLIKKLLDQETFTREDLIRLLSCEGKDQESLFRKAAFVKNENVGNKVYFRGLIEFSNKCGKNCFYCGVRAGNKSVIRYELADEEVVEAAMYAHEHQFASIVIQSGERKSKRFSSRIENVLKKIHDATQHELHVTLSLGEQSEETYRRWYDAGAHRYLLRIEVSNPELYQKLHPRNDNHDYNKRLEALRSLKRVGYQVGTGVMIGLPFQTLADLADDLLFLKEFDIDMAGMGPYIEHHETPLYQYRHLLLPKEKRFELALKMIALLRLLMKNINIAATTAMQTLHPEGREKAIQVGANVIMPNLTPVRYRENYLLYENKPCLTEESDACRGCLEARLRMAGSEVGYGDWGDSRHFIGRKK